ncbi:MAG TPA: hypothetical protein VFN17_00555 [Nitrosarchaeum sp.]|nr:hypothetical protein [Nitrosarchaeum sp.]
MIDIFEIFSTFSYLGPLIVLFLMNLSPILMPPNWLILSSFYALDDSMNLTVLVVVGATASTAGRFVLKQLVSKFKNHSNNTSNLTVIGNYLNKKKYGYVISSFVFAVTPLPDNILFVAYGLIKAKSIGMYVGFWVGKLLAFYVMLTISPAVLVPFTRIFEDRLIGILLADCLGIIAIIVFAAIDWNVLLNEKKLRFIKPRLWRF